MTIFAIIAPAENARLRDAVKEAFPNRYLEFAGGQFVGSTYGLTAMQVAEKLGDHSKVGSYVVFSVAGYWGSHRKDLWEWLSANSD